MLIHTWYQFDAKDDRYEPDSEDEDESKAVPVSPQLVISIHMFYYQYADNAQGEMVEYQDEFGRTRTGPRSEISHNADSNPSDASKSQDTTDDIYDPMVEYEDEFGRVRTVRRSEVPRQFQRRAIHDDEVPEDEYINSQYILELH